MIADSTLALVKQRTDIVALIGETVKLARSGSSYKGLCPFHKEKSGSFYVHPERGFFHCFGCGESGDALTFVMKQNGLDFREALVFLAERAGVTIEESDQRQRSGPSKSLKDEIYAANHVAATFFESQLGASRSERVTDHHPLAHMAMAELARRGMPNLANEDERSMRWMHVLQAFRVGYAPPEWDGLARFLAAQGISPVVGERAGLLVPRANTRAGAAGHYDRFRHRLMFAVIDTLGRVVAFSGRALDAPDPQEAARIGNVPSFQEKPAKYINSPESAVYTKGEQLFGLYQARNALRERGEAVLVEGNFDVVTLHAQGFDHAVAPLGTAFTSDQARLLKRFAPRVCCLFDGDAAGRKATRASREPCRVGGLVARVARLPDGTDPDELVRKEGPAALEIVIKNGRGMLEYLIDDALNEAAFGGATLNERGARVRHIAELLRTEDDPTVRAMGKSYADQLSQNLILHGAAPRDLSDLERTLRNALERPRNDAPTNAPPPDAARSTTPSGIASSALGSILDFPELLEDEEVQAVLTRFEGDTALAIAALRQHLREREGRMDVAEFLANVPRSIHSFASYRLASPRFEDLGLARQNLIENATLLDEVHFKREKAAALTQLSSMADFSEADAALALELQRRARAKARG